MEIYLVGGAVRDKLLELPVKDRDWVVVGATPQAMLDQGYQKVGKDFPVFLHPDSKEEYALARTERKTGKGYYGFECYAAPDVSLEQDLERRDLTINAMAEDSHGKLIDPFNGEQDLHNGVLRHVSPAFAEDPVRILRIARFAARYARWGFHVAHSTNKLMRQMVANGEVDELVAERVWAETQKALSEQDPARYFQVLHGCNALAVIFPEIENLYEDVTKDQHSSNNNQPLIYGLLASRVYTQEDSSQLAATRFAILMSGIYICTGNNEAIKTLCKRIKVPSQFRDLSFTTIRLIQQLTTSTILDAKHVMQCFDACDAFRNPGRFLHAMDSVEQLLGTAAHFGLQHIIEPGNRAIWNEFKRLLESCLNLNARDLDIKGLQGKEIGVALYKARLQRLQDLID